MHRRFPCPTSVPRCQPRCPVRGCLAHPVSALKLHTRPPPPVDVFFTVLRHWLVLICSFTWLPFSSLSNSSTPSQAIFLPACPPYLSQPLTFRAACPPRSAESLLTSFGLLTPPRLALRAALSPEAALDCPVLCVGIPSTCLGFWHPDQATFLLTFKICVYS